MIPSIPSAAWILGSHSTLSPGDADSQGQDHAGHLCPPSPVRTAGTAVVRGIRIPSWITLEQLEAGHLLSGMPYLGACSFTGSLQVVTGCGSSFNPDEQAACSLCGADRSRCGAPCDRERLLVPFGMGGVPTSFPPS